MKYLEIKEKEGFFKRGGEMILIEKITAEDLLELLNHAHEDDFDMDQYVEADLPNKAQQIIYENLHNKLKDFLENKEQFSNEVNELYQEAIQKYGADIDSEPEPEENNNPEPQNDIEPEDIPF